VANVTFKRGDYFALSIEALMQDLTGWTVRSQVRRGSTLVHELTVEDWTPAPGGSSFQLVALTPSVSLPGVDMSKPGVLGATDDWPVGELLCDIEYTGPTGVIISTETFTIECVADITR
jgi:hypothetical protein